ncbi:MAG: PIN domain nuclease [Pseudonocardiaceae bacterium]|nr:PIN domain nuclease [Pseudonocardiaceae bacterium]
MTEPMVPAFVLDSGALIALERAAPAMTALLLRVRSGHARLVVPDAVLAQVWRGGSGRQARIAALLGLQRKQCERVALETDTAKRIGMRIHDCGHADVVDVHVALLVGEHRAAVITSDRDDILAVDSNLKDRIVEV